MMEDEMRDAQRRHVLDGGAWAVEADFQPAGQRGFQMRRGADVTRHVLRLDPAVARAQGRVLGFDVGQEINSARELETLQTGQPNVSLRLGPDEWLLIGELSDAAHAASLKLTDVSHRNLAIEVRGEAVHEVLQTGVAMDLDDAAFPVGAATRTLFGKAEIVLVHWRDGAGGSVFRIECWRSFGRYLSAHLKQSATLIGVDSL